ncbi:MAG: flagellar protein FlgN [Pelotomaculum sp.]|nr:flagellar protein FlgN [Pelotomaculum sp.]
MAAGSLFEELYRCLLAQGEVLGRCLAAGEAQIEALKENDLARVRSITAEQEAFAAQLKKLEEERLSIQHALEGSLNIKSGASLNDLLPYAPAELRPSLQKACADLRHKIENLKEINSFCALLVRKILKINEKLIQILSSGAAGRCYGEKGELHGGLQLNPVLNKSV